MSTPDYRVLLKNSLLKIEALEARLAKQEATKAEPVAVVGMACRFPGEAHAPDSLWRLLRDGVDAVRKIPAERWPAEAIPGENPAVRWAGLLDSVDGFDASFFEVSPREAASLDPQQRLLLEVAWEAMEDAGLRPERLAKSQTGVFLGLSSTDYRQRVNGKGIDGVETYDLTGTLLSTAAGRLSYVFGFQGPCLSIDTACSSSLVAVHEAVQSLRRGESEVALTGGANLILDPMNSAMLGRMQALSPDGRCKTFDAAANGFVRGEGCGIVVLKRLSDAERDGDRIWALIKGSAINQDGRSTGLTAPNVLAQQALLRQALADAKVAPSDIGYVESHGTGTSLGDPIEFEALREVLGQPRPDGSTCAIGALKTNLGHLEAAAGVAGLIKAVLVLRREAIPRNLNFRSINPRISLSGTPFVFPTRELPWPRGTKPRRAGVSAFGLSGTNAHVVLEEAPAAPRPVAPAARDSAVLLPLSAKTPAALRAQANQWAEHLSTDGAESLADHLYTASVRRGHHPHRLAVLGHSREALSSQLRAFLAREPQDPAQVEEPGPRTRKAVFVFPGQGGQWQGMGRRLLEEERVFREAIEACDRAIRPHVDWSLLEVLRGEGTRAALEDVDVIQPSVFAMQVGLAALWRSWGVEPHAVVGHSLGEVAAAHVAGALSLEDAARIICVRSRLVKRARGQGGMAVVELSADEAREALRGYEGRLAVGAVNGPRARVLSGEREALAEVLARLEKAGVFCRWVKVDYASHSPQMEPLRAELLRLLADVRPVRERVPLYSTVTGKRNEELLTAEYWERNLREPVRFWDVIEQLGAEGHETFLEINAHPVLLPSIEEGLRERCASLAVLPSLRRDEGGRERLLTTLGALYTVGHSVDWARLHPEGGHVVSVPSYPWQRERFWLESSTAPAPRRGGNRVQGATAHPLLGPHVALSHQPGTHVWQMDVGVADLSWAADHRVQDTVVLPGTAWVDIALGAARQVLGEGRHVLSRLVCVQPVFLAAEGTRTLQVVMTERPSGGADFQCFALDARAAAPAWVPVAEGAVELASGATQERLPSAEVIQARCPRIIEGDAHVQAMAERGLHFGPAFQGLQRLWQGEREAYAHLRLPEVLAGHASEHLIHPAFLDASFQLLMSFLPVGATYVGRGVESARFEGPVPSEVWAHLRLRDGEGAAFSGDLTLRDAEGRQVAEVSGIQVSRLPGTSWRAVSAELADWMYQVGWEAQALPEPLTWPEKSPGTWVLFADSRGVARELRGLLAARGESCVWVTPGASYRSVGEGAYEVDPRDAEHVRRLLSDALPSGAPVCRGVVHLWSLDSAPNDALNPQTLERARHQGTTAMLHLVQALARAGWRDAPRLWLVTQGARSVGPSRERVSVAQAPLWGLGQVIAMEHPELRCTRVDLSTDAAGASDALFRELSSASPEDQVALRDGARHVARFLRAAEVLSLEDAVAPRGARSADAAESLSPRDSSARVVADGTYLITGGLGGLGLQVARWLVEQGARHLVLLGRAAPSTDAEATLGQLREAGTRVEVVRADVSSPEDVARAMAVVDGAMPPLKGVMHAAGLLDDGVLLNLTEERFATVMAPKVLGAWNLHEATRQRPLDFFVLFSSAAALLGSPGQGNYASANAFLDALAQARRAEGLPGLSIAWGAWTGIGLAARASPQKRIEARGLRGMSPDKALAALGLLLGQDRPQVGVVSLDLRQWMEFYLSAAQSPFFARLAGQLASSRPSDSGRGKFREKLEQAGGSERRALLERHLREQIAAVLRMDPERLGPRVALGSLGLDSLMGMEIRNRLEASLGLKLSATLVWAYPTLVALVAFLSERLGLSSSDQPPRAEESAPEAPAPAALTSAAVSSEIEDLSEAEVERLLAQRMAQGT
ncbi:polyketide synthase [Myxococcus stipitatus DSM 14675]|uniref:Polyketide synthase n=1 Tax=Myxococcus stipitatus (strain DSM 14675 / JCM 12634 / Mx s8) TaxID=1278073 RepID=L7UC18_MYXSD|nr:type I polyketide synthase [Myxococcus stipitatus]AGC45623.1 polyketide synthase [Myxococcus stipitatus DSM 14675]